MPPGLESQEPCASTAFFRPDFLPSCLFPVSSRARRHAVFVRQEKLPWADALRHDVTVCHNVHRRFFPCLGGLIIFGHRSMGAAYPLSSDRNRSDALVSDGDFRVAASETASP
jgi:hypothetical protein